MPATDLHAGSPKHPTRPYLREGLLLLGFIAVLALSAFTVVLPELSREPDIAAKSQPPAQSAAPAASP